MGVISIPNEDKRLVKADAGELFGNILITKNINLETNPGKIRLSERFYRIFDKDDDTDFDLPVDFVRTNADQTDRWWALSEADGFSASDGLLWKTTNTVPTSGWAQDAITNTPTDAKTKMVIFGEASSYDRLVVARDNDLAMLNNGTWTASWWQSTLSGSALDATVHHHLHVFTNLLIIPDANLVHTVDDSLVKVESRITLPDEYEIIWTENDGEFVYFGTEHRREGDALVFPWRPGDETYSDPIPVYDSITMAGANNDGIMHTINGKGQVLRNVGGAFEEVARLPVADFDRQWHTESGTTPRRMVHPNGMKFIDDELHILLTGMIAKQTDQVMEEMPSGIWTLNEHGIRQKYSVGNFDGSTNNDWGSPIVHTVGALVDIGVGSGRFLIGAQVYKTASTLQPAIYASKTTGTSNQRGYLVTVQLTATHIRALWTRLHVLFKKLDNSTDRIVVKYRTQKNKNFEESNFAANFFQGTWDSSNNDKLTINDSDGSNITAGDEIEVLRGIGSGALAHVSTITNTSGSNYTIVLDEEIPNVANAGTFTFRVQNWTKLGEISDQTLKEKIYTIAKREKWLQLKVELRGTHFSPELEKLLQEFNDSR